MLTGTEVKSLRTGRSTIAKSYASVDGKWRSLADQRQYPRIPRRQPFQPRTQAPQETASQAPRNRQAVAGRAARGHDHRAAQTLFQRAGTRQDRGCAGQGQAGPRQARNRKATRLEPRKKPPDETEGLKRERGWKTGPVIVKNKSRTQKGTQIKAHDPCNRVMIQKKSWEGPRGGKTAKPFFHGA